MVFHGNEISLVIDSKIDLLHHQRFYQWDHQKSNFPISVVYIVCILKASNIWIGIIRKPNSTINVAGWTEKNPNFCIVKLRHGEGLKSKT